MSRLRESLEEFCHERAGVSVITPLEMGYTMILVPVREEFRPYVAQSEVRGRQRIFETARKKLQAEASNNGQFQAPRHSAVEAHASPPRADDPLVHRHNENGSSQMPSRIGRRREKSAPGLELRAR